MYACHENPKKTLCLRAHDIESILERRDDNTVSHLFVLIAPQLHLD